MNVLSLFSGIGGLDLGLERAGMTVAGQVEIDPWCRKVLAKHWPEVPRHDDVRTAAAWWGGRPSPDLVCGGFPCQPVSLAGKGLAQADSRWLWPAFADIIRDLRPRYALMENVPGLLGRGLGDVLGDLAAIGYDAEWDCIPAVFVGAPHIRNRVWIVAYPAAVQRGAQQRRQPDRVLPEVLADAERDGLQGAEHAIPWQGTPVIKRRPAYPRVADAAHADRELLGWPSEPRCERGHWAAEPDVGRVANGIPRRVDRLRGLGNAVVPQVAEHIGRLIMTAAAA